MSTVLVIGGTGAQGIPIVEGIHRYNKGKFVLTANSP